MPSVHEFGTTNNQDTEESHGQEENGPYIFDGYNLEDDMEMDYDEVYGDDMQDEVLGPEDEENQQMNDKENVNEGP